MWLLFFFLIQFGLENGSAAEYAMEIRNTPNYSCAECTLHLIRKYFIEGPIIIVRYEQYDMENEYDESMILNEIHVSQNASVQTRYRYFNSTQV